MPALWRDDQELAADFQQLTRELTPDYDGQ